MLAKRMLQDGLALHPMSVSFQLAAQLDLLLGGGTRFDSRCRPVFTLPFPRRRRVSCRSRVAQGALHMQATVDEAEAIRGTIDFSRQCLQIAVVTAVAASLVAYPGIVLVYGDRWAGSVVPFVILSIAGIAVAFESPMRTVVARVGRPITLALLAVVMMGANVLLTVALIGLFGMIGAAIGTVFAYWLFAFGLIWLLRRAAPNAELHELFRPRRSDLLAAAVRDLVRRVPTRRRATRPA